jgi:hypothetical protein
VNLKRLSIVVYIYNPNYMSSIGGESWFKDSPGQKQKTLSEITKRKMVGFMAQVVKCLYKEVPTLISNPSTTKNQLHLISKQDIRK